MKLNNSMHNNRSIGSELSLSSDYQNKLKQAKSKEEDSNKKESTTNSHVAPDIMTISQKAKKMSMVELLMQQKESLKERIDRQSQQLALVKEQKALVPYEEEIFVDPNGKERVQKVYTEDNQKQLARLENQELKLQSKLEESTKELLGFDEQIQQAIIQESQKKQEERKEELKEKYKQDDTKPKTEEEAKQDKEKRQMEFMLQGDAVKRYVSDAKVTAARLESEKTRKENEMANDRNFHKQQDQRALESQMRATLAYEQGIPEEDVIVPISKVADTSALQERSRIASGKFMPDEAQDAAELRDLSATISRLNDSVDRQLGSLNKEIRKENEEDKEIKDKKVQIEEEKKKEEAAKENETNIVF